MFSNYSTIFLNSSENKISEIVLLMLRIGTSTLMVYVHGWQKLKNYSAILSNFPELIGLGAKSCLLLAIFGEIICSILLAFDFFTIIVVIPLCITVVIAALIFNTEQAFIVRQKALSYLKLYVFFFVVGIDKYSTDHFVLQKTT